MDLYGGLFSLSLLLRAHIFPLIMYERLDANLIASFGLLNQVGLLSIFVLRGYMNTHQRELAAFYAGSSLRAGILGLYFRFSIVTALGAGIIIFFSAEFFKDPFSLSKGDKEKYIIDASNSLTRHHYKKCPEYRKVIKSLFDDKTNASDLSSIPFIPVQIFKNFDLLFTFFFKK